MKESDILPVPGDYDMGQNIRPINKSEPQDISVIWKERIRRV